MAQLFSYVVNFKGLVCSILQKEEAKSATGESRANRKVRNRSERISHFESKIVYLGRWKTEDEKVLDLSDGVLARVCKRKF